MNTYRAQCGRRREYNSQDDADRYDLGWSDWPGYYTPAHAREVYDQGWYDREQDQQDRDDARVERYLRETEE